MPRVTFGGFSIEPPEGWSLTTVILAAPVQPQDPPEEAPAPGRTFQPNLVMVFEQVTEDITASSYFERQVTDLRKAGVGRREVGHPETVSLPGGAQGLLTEQVVLGPSGERARQMQLISVKNGVAATLIGSTLDGPQFEAFRDQLRRMLTSLS
jgi:hypothetical protein